MSLYAAEDADRTEDAQRADTASEMAVLGWLIDNRDHTAVAEVWTLLSPEDFYRPAHREVARVCQRLFLNGEPVDPARVFQECVATDIMRLFGGKGAGYLHSLLQFAAVGAANANWHVKRIVEAARVRDTVVLTNRTLQQLANPNLDLLCLLTDLGDEILALQVNASVSIDLGLTDFPDFLEVAPQETDFVIPGLLGRREKVIFTGGEGIGKSTLFRQFALAAAAGLHPFSHELAEPKRVLWLDAENHEDTSRELFRRIYENSVIPRGRAIHKGMLTLKHLRSFDLLSDRDVTWATRVVTDVRPDLIYLGPLYQVVGGSLNDEVVAQRVVRVLNRLCHLSGAAMVLEAHAGHGKGAGGAREWRPRGSSVLLGWPDFGFGLGVSDEPGAEVNRMIDVHPWRGERHMNRHWPKQLIKGSAWPFDGYGW